MSNQDCGLRSLPSDPGLGLTQGPSGNIGVTGLNVLASASTYTPLEAALYQYQIIVGTLTVGPIALAADMVQSQVYDGVLTVVQYLAEPEVQSQVCGGALTLDQVLAGNLLQYQLPNGSVEVEVHLG